MTPGEATIGGDPQPDLNAKEREMENGTMFLDCPAYLGKDGAARCGLPAEVELRYTLRSTSGPSDSARIRCPRGHYFNGAIESLTPAGAVGLGSGTDLSNAVARILTLAHQPIERAYGSSSSR